jgi:hypothetical protein
MPRNRVTAEQLTEIFLRWSSYHMIQQPELHPTFRTPEQRAERARLRARKRRAVVKKQQP